MVSYLGAKIKMIAKVLTFNHMQPFPLKSTNGRAGKTILVFLFYKYLCVLIKEQYLKDICTQTNHFTLKGLFSECCSVFLEILSMRDLMSIARGFNVIIGVYPSNYERFNVKGVKMGLNYERFNVDHESKNRVIHS